MFCGHKKKKKRETLITQPSSKLFICLLLHDYQWTGLQRNLYTRCSLKNRTFTKKISNLSSIANEKLKKYIRKENIDICVSSMNRNIPYRALQTY